MGVILEKLLFTPGELLMWSSLTNKMMPSMQVYVLLLTF